MKDVLFATTNPRKVKEANATLKTFGVAVASVALEIDEIQHHDPETITKAKARAAYAITQKPVVVSDTSWNIYALNGFPGGYMKEVAKWLSEDDWLALMASHEDKRAVCMEHLAYFDGTDLVHFSFDYPCEFLTKPQGEPVKNESFSRILTIDGQKSLAESPKDEDQIEPLPHWIKFGEWFALQ